MRSPGLALTASAVLTAEGAALLVFALIELFGLGAGDASSLPTAIALIVLTLVGAIGLFAFAWGTRSGQSWARSGGVVVQVLAIAIALASLTLAPIPWTFTLAVGLPGVLGLALILASARREAPERGRPDPDDAEGPKE